MRLADFILANVEPILAEWEVFARGIWPGAATGGADPATLRDHAGAILRAVAQDMASAQTAAQQSDKSKGGGQAGDDSDRVDAASKQHGIDRVASPPSRLLAGAGEGAKAHEARGDARESR